MPKVLKKFEFKVRGESDYNWEEFLDGKIREFVPGEDFDCKTLSFQAMARGQAARKLKGININVQESGNVVLQAYELTDEQKEELKEKREAAKQRMKDKRAAAKAEANGQTTEETEGETGEETE